MDMMELIRTRKSVRTFDGNAVTENDIKKLTEYIETITNPFGVPVGFVLLDAKEHSLSSPVIQGEHLYIAGKVPKTEHCAEAFGYSFEKMVLYAWSLGIGTTWIGGTMKREQFEKEAGVREGEIMPCISPLGYPAKKRSIKEIGMRTAIRADKRIKSEELFFENDLGTPLRCDDVTVRNALEAVRLAPSAVNKQPWRIVKCGNDYHFYEKHTLASGGAAWDVQKVDVGIAICHFMSIAGGTLSFEKPETAVGKDTEYIATVTL
ncbi:Nitroreductase [Ruminococcus sp. YRD2003]|uniref:nitroreductase family protein n=1 Tax=Ruminococcus sp. YRD2003 TaxID=1452313 RepID=UPI0008CC37AC|nr:Nitroreductase [Ruminococcus flavefaciens]